MLKSNISPKRPRTSFATIRLQNGNVVKFSHRNQKYFTIGDPMSFSIVKMGNKKPKTSPSPCTTWTHLIQQCLGPPHAPPQTAAPTVEALSHTYAVKSPLDTMARPVCAPKSIPVPVDRSTNPTTCLIPGPVRPMMRNGIRIRSAVFPQCTGQTDRPTDRPRESLMTIARYASNESDAA